MNVQIVFNRDFEVVIKTLRNMILTKEIIAELDKQNRIRRLSVYNPMPRIDYDIDYIENLVEGCHGQKECKQNIINLIIKDALQRA